MSKKVKGQKIKQGGEDLLLPGKFQCQCHGMAHKLINNCINCGRIVCEQEGEGPCQTCGELVVAKIVGKGINTNTQEIDEQFPEMNFNIDKEEQKAIAHKNKLIQFDKTNYAQKNVFDEQTDWYQIADDVWQGKEARTNAVKQLLDRQDQIYENQQGKNISFSAQGWVEKNIEFDEIKFKQEADSFLNKMISKEINQESEIGKLGEKEKQLYENIKQELNAIKCGQDAKSGKKNKQTEPLVQPNQRVLSKVVQMDDFYSSFI